MEKKYGLRCPNVFHAGDGNLHPLILFDANDPGRSSSAPRRFAGEVLEKCVEVGGTITGEHGVGVEKINQMCVQFGTAEIEQLPGRQARLRSRGPAQSRQEHPDAASLRRVRPHAREGRAAAASRAAAILGVRLRTNARSAGPSRSRRLPACSGRGRRRDRGRDPGVYGRPRRRGESGLELHINTDAQRAGARRTIRATFRLYHGVRITPEFSWGLGHGFDWGLYLPTTTDSDGHYYFGGAKLRVKWLPIRAAEEAAAAGTAGINNELSDLNKAFSDSRWNDEVRFIGGYRGARLAHRPQPHPRVGPVAGISRQSRLHACLQGDARSSPADSRSGAEYYQDYGPLSNPLPRDEQNRTLYAVDGDRAQGLVAELRRRPRPDARHGRLDGQAIVGVSFN